MVDIRQTADDVTVFDDKGNSWTADILIGCDGVKSVVRQSLLGDTPRVTGHVVYRAVVDAADMPDDLRINAPVLWAGPHCHGALSAARRQAVQSGGDLPQPGDRRVGRARRQ